MFEEFIPMKIAAGKTNLETPTSSLPELSLANSRLLPELWLLLKYGGLAWKNGEVEVDLAVVAVVDVVIASDVVVEVLLTVVVVAISSTVVASVEGASVDDSSIVVASVVENPVVASSTVGCSVVETSAVGSSVVVGSVVDISVVGSSEEAVVSSVSDVGMPSVADEVAGSVVGNSVSIAVEISVVANSSAGEVVVSSEVDVDDMLNSSDEVILSSSSFPEGHSLATIIEASSDSSRRSCSSRE